MPQPRWLTGLAGLVFAAAVLLPLAQLAGAALWADGRLELSPWRELLLTASQWRLLRNSLLLAGGATGVALLLGLPYALLCQKTNLWGRRVFGLAYLAPLLIPPYLQAIAWNRLLAADGPINGALMGALELAAPPLNACSLPGAVFVLGLAYFPFVTLLVSSGLNSVDRGVEEAALLRGGAFRTLTRITLPLVRPHILAGAIFVFVFAIIDFGVPDILRVRVYPIEIFIQFSALYDERAAIMLGLPLLVITTILVAWQARLMRGRSYVSFASGGVRRYPLGRAAGLGLLFCLTTLTLAVLAPVVVLARTAGSLSVCWQTLLTSWDQIAFSFGVAAAGAAAMTVLAFVLAHAMVRSSGWRGTALDYLTQLPFAVPPMLLGLGLIKTWNRPVTDWLYGSALIIVIGYLAHFIPFAVRAVYASLRQLNPALEEAGWLARSNRFAVTARITLPLISPGLLTGFFIGLVLSLGELGTTLLVIPPGLATLPIKLYNLIHYGAEAAVAALALILLALQLLLALAVLGLSRWIARRPA